jgi:FG-GAP-like repeat/FG-GAP repeat
MSPSITLALFRRIAAGPIRRLYAVALAAILFSFTAETTFAQSVTPSVFSVTRDLNGDGYSDLIWRNMITGDVAVSMTGDVGIVSRSTVVHGLDLNWQIAGVGDVDGDGKADIVWRNNYSGDVAEWLMDGATVKSYATIASVPDLSWEVAGIGDLDGDGRADLVWRNTRTGNVAEWLMNGTTIREWNTLNTGIDAPWRVAGVGDLDGDGRADLIWRNVQTGDVVAWLIDACLRRPSLLFKTQPGRSPELETWTATARQI